MNIHICKAKSIGMNEWVQGYYVQKTDPMLGYTYTYLVTQGHDEWTKTQLSSFVTWYQVDPETVCRYTGLNDKYDNPIFEHDIVSCPNESNGEIIWFSYKNYHGWTVMRNNKVDVTFDPYLWDIEIIGNKFDVDNTELMED